MKRILFILMAFFCFGAANAQEKAQITFEKVAHNFGTFSEDNPVVTCTFSFSNTGTAPLIINQALASCGCTVPQYPKAPILPGKKGVITVVYNGKGKFPGHFKKTVTINSNAENNMVRLTIEGDMKAAKAN